MASVLSIDSVCGAPGGTVDAHVYKKSITWTSRLSESVRLVRHKPDHYFSLKVGFSNGHQCNEHKGITTRYYFPALMSFDMCESLTSQGMYI